MSLNGQITNLFMDKNMTVAAFPRTKTKAITNDNNENLEDILNSVIYSSEDDTSGDVVASINVDTLGGYPAENYATKNYVSAKIAEAQLSGGAGDGSGIDLSGFATKEYVLAMINEVLGGIENGAY